MTSSSFSFAFLFTCRLFTHAVTIFRPQLEGDLNPAIAKMLHLISPEKNVRVTLLKKSHSRDVRRES